MRIVGLVLLGIGTLSGCATVQTEAQSRTEVRLVSDIEWQKLNPARGDLSPQAGTIWGDRHAGTDSTSSKDNPCPISKLDACEDGVPTGFLVKFVDGFSSPPHIHNVTYRAVVISGLIHNDDPNAEPMWMPAGSFWTQPKGEVHITGAQGDDAFILVEIDSGPYLVKAPEHAFDSGERPVNIVPSNLVWLDLDTSGTGAQVAYLWGTPRQEQSHGAFLKLPAGFDGMLNCRGDFFQTVVISGALTYSGETQEVLEPGSSFASAGRTTHRLSVEAQSECILYIRTNAEYELNG